jgi:uncharacterized protein YndB with AHSA1/START domain
MTTNTEPGSTTQVYRVYIKATPEAIWDAITKPEWSERYGYGGVVDYDLRPGGAYRAYPGEAMRREGAARGLPIPDVVVDGEIIEVDPPRRLVQTWRMLMDPGMAAEGFTRLTYELEADTGGVTRLTVIHQLDNAPMLAALLAGEAEGEGAGGGWNEVLSDLKTLLETGKSLRE